MALLTNINDLFTVDSTGAISFNRVDGSTTTGYTFPATDGTDGYVLKTNGDGVLDWAPDSNTGTVTGTGVANKVAYWTSATNIDDGPITFATNDSTFAGNITANTGSKITSSSADTTFSIETTSGTTIFPILDFVSSHSSAGARIRVSGTDVISLDKSQNSTFAGQVQVNKAKSGTGVENYDLIRLNLSGTGAVGDSSTIGWFSTSGTKTAGIEGISGLDNILYGELAFHVRRYTTDTYDEVMRINNRGNVGIGTDSPEQKLEVNSSGSTTIVTSSASDDCSIAFKKGAGATPTWRIGRDTSNSDALSFAYLANGYPSLTGSYKVVMTTGGSVGIGTDSPVTKLEVTPSISNSSIKTGTLELQSYSVNNAWLADNVYYSGAWYLRSTGYASQVYFGSGGDISFKRFATGNAGTVATPVLTMQLDSAGNVGIGKSQSGNAALTVRSSAGGNTGIILIEGDTTDDGWGVYATTANKYIITRFTGGSYSDKFTILEGGGVGIGTSSPGRGLTIDKSNEFAALEIIKNNTTNQIVYLGTGSSAGTDDPILQLKHNGTENIRLYATGNSWINGGRLAIGSTVAQYGVLEIQTESAVAYSPTVFTNGANIRLKSGGTATTGTTTGISFGAGGACELYFGVEQQSSTLGHAVWQGYNGTAYLALMRLSHDGNLTVKGDVVAYGSPSDKKLKENIKPIKSALDKAMKLQGVTFDWKKSDSELNIKEDIGFIAQDVQKVIPELVRENEDGMLSMRHQGIAPILLEAIKELKAEIEELKKHNCNCNK